MVDTRLNSKPLSYLEPTEGAQSNIGQMHADLHIFYRTGQFDMKAVPFSETYERGHWSWPPRV